MEEFLIIVQKCNIIFMTITALFGFIFSIKKKDSKEKICKILITIFLIVFMIIRIILNK